MPLDTYVFHGTSLPVRPLDYDEPMFALVTDTDGSPVWAWVDQDVNLLPDLPVAEVRELADTHHLETLRRTDGPSSAYGSDVDDPHTELHAFAEALGPSAHGDLSAARFLAAGDGTKGLESLGLGATRLALLSLNPQASIIPSADEVFPQTLIRVLELAGVIGAPPTTWHWDDRPHRPPRRRFRGKPSVFFPPMNRRWLERIVKTGIINHRHDLAHCLPEEAFEHAAECDWLGGRMRQVLRIAFRRSGASQPEETPEVLAEALREDIGDWDERQRSARVLLSMTYRVDDADRVDRFLAHRILNGKYPMPLRHTDDGAYEALWQYTDLPFGDPLGRDHDYYRLPDVRARLRVVEGEPRMASISFRYRDTSSPQYAMGGESAYGAWSTVDMRAPDLGGTSPLWKRERARRILSGAMLLTAQLDQHVSRGHIVPEAYAVAMHRHLSKDHPIRRLLAPRVAEVDIVNWNADALIWGPYGLLSVASAITSDGLSKRFHDRLAGLDWKGFAPRSETVCDSHYAPRVHTLYWREVVLPYVADGLAALGGPLSGWWSAPADERSRRWRREARSFFGALRSVWPDRRAWDDVPGADWLDPSEFAAGADGSAGYSEVVTEGDVEAAVAFAIYHATLGHGWPNVRQMEGGGEPAWAAFGLRAEYSDQPPQEDVDIWHRLADPLPADILYSLVIGNVLTTLEIDTFAAELEGESALASGVSKDPFLGTSRGLAARWRNLLPKVEVVMQDDPYKGTPLADTHCRSGASQLSRTNR